MESTTKCKAWQFTSNGRITDNLKLNDIDIPTSASRLNVLLNSTSWFKSYPGKSGVLIRVAAASLNPSDYKLLKEGSANFLVRKPGIPGFDFSGVVVCTLGPTSQNQSQSSGSNNPGNNGNENENENNELAPGTRVYGHLVPEWKIVLGTGTLAEYIIAFPPIILPIPPSLSFEAAASSFLTGITGWQALVDQGKLKAGQRVFVNGGSGGTGVWGIQLAKALGAYVVSTCSPASRDLLKRIGADELIDYRATPLIPHLTEHYSEPSKQFDIIYDCIGTGDPDTRKLFQHSASFLSPTGSFLDITSLANPKGVSGHVKDGLMVVKNMFLPTIFGGVPRRYVPIVLRSGYAGDAFRKLDALLREGKIEPIIDSCFEFEDAPAAFERLMSGRAKGKIVVRVSKELCESYRGKP